MNFLAHVHLSWGNAGLITGNLVADAYKGSKHQLLPKDIMHGVILHRKIDHLTDSFDKVLEMKKVLAPYFGRYAGIALDVYFDHFLSVKWENYNNSDLSTDVSSYHIKLNEQILMVNEESHAFLSRLIQSNWLLSYYDKIKLEQIFTQMAKRFGINELNNSILPLERHYFEIEATFEALYPFLVNESKSYKLNVGL